MNNYHMITDATAYAALRLDLITMGEGEETGVYVDTAREGNPSIGYGYNLNSRDVRNAVIEELAGLQDGATEEQITANEQYQQVLVDEIAAFNADLDGNGTITQTERTQAAAQLQQALDGIMAQRAADPRLAGLTDRTAFRFNNAAEMQDVFNAIAPIYEARVDAWLADIPPSRERVALISLAYNQREDNRLLGDGLRSAIVNDNRAEAWYEIRYNSNSGSLNNPQPDGVEGIAKRRYIESSIFGLYETTSDNATQEEAIEIYHMYTAHQRKILAYEARYHDDALVNAQGEGAAIGVTVSTLEQAFGPAYDQLMLEYGEDAITIDYRDIQVAAEEGGFLEGHRRDGWTLSDTAPEVNDLLIGRDGNDSLEGGDGDDILIGGGGVDFLTGGAGNDVLRGGADDDMLEGGTGNDKLYGGDGNDSLEGGGGDDILIGNEGDDTLYGQDGNDYLYGGGDNDRLYGGLGNNYLYGGTGADEYYIVAKDNNFNVAVDEQGDDTYYIRSEFDGVVNITDSDGWDTYDINGDTGALSVTINGGGVDDDLYLNGKPISVAFSVEGATNTWRSEDGTITITHNSPLTITDDLGNTIVADNYVDGIFGLNLVDRPTTTSLAGVTLLNDDENSAVIVRSTAHIGDPDGPVEYTAAIDAVYGRVGDDRVYIENIDLNQGIQIHNGEGSDRLGTINPDIDFIYTPLEPAVGAMNYTDGARLYGDGGDDLLMGTYRSDWLEGGVGNDMLRGYSGDDFVFGNEDDDVLDGRMGEDSLFGGQGVDALYGGEGADYLEGGGGDDDGLFVNARHDPVRLLPHCRPRYQENPSW